MRETDLISKPMAARRHWRLDPEIVFLNHGSFGACPRAVLKAQEVLRTRMERQPITFFVRDLEGLLDQSRSDLARFVCVDPNDLVFVHNATAGVNTVLKSLKFHPGDELVVTNHEYNACQNALNFVAERSRAKVVVAQVPFPFRDEDELITPILEKLSARTRLVLLDHVTSQTGVVMPLEKIVREMNHRGIPSLIDGAHAPGMIPLNLAKLKATYYAGNCHKWICGPKSAAFLYVSKEHQKEIRPLSISHGANSPRKDRSRFLIEFGWTGTWDPTAMLCVPEALKVMASFVEGGWPAIMRRNRKLAIAAQKVICDALEIELPCPEQFLGALVSIPLPGTGSSEPSKSPLYLDPSQDDLMKLAKIEVPVIPWPAPPQKLLRISAQLYNALPQYQKLAEALKQIFKRERTRPSLATRR